MKDAVKIFKSYLNNEDDRIIGWVLILIGLTGILLLTV